MDEHGREQSTSYGMLALVLLALLGLTALTVTVARSNLGELKILTALSIAATKASLVLLFFMHMRKEGRAIAVSFIVTIVILAIFIGFIFFDIVYRYQSG